LFSIYLHHLSFTSFLAGKMPPKRASEKAEAAPPKKKTVIMTDQVSEEPQKAAGGEDKKPNLRLAKSMKLYESAKASEQNSVTFRDDEKRQVMFELSDKKIMNFYVNGKQKVSNIKTLFVMDRTFHVQGKKIMASDCTCHIPESEKEQIIFDVMELYARRAPVCRNERRLLVVLESARGLRDADGLPGQGVSDPYCVASIPGKAESRIQTKFIKDTLNPVWHHMGEVSGWVPGDMLVFDVWDKDWCSRDDYLGRAELALEDENGLPQFEGELMLKDAGAGIEAYLKVQIISGTRLERAAIKVIECLRDTSVVLEIDLLERLIDDAKDVGMTGKQVERAEVLLRLMKAFEAKEIKPIRSALEAAQEVELFDRPEYQDAVKFIALHDARQQLHEAEYQHRNIVALEEAIRVAKEAGATDEELKAHITIANDVKKMKEAAATGDKAARDLAVKIAYERDYIKWRGFEELTNKCLEEAVKEPNIADLETAVKMGQDTWASDELMLPAQNILAALQILQKVSTSKSPRFDDLMHAIQQVSEAAGVGPNDEVKSPEVTRAWGVLRNTAKASLAEACTTPTKDSLATSIKNAKTAGLTEADCNKAQKMLSALETLTKATRERKLDGLKAAVKQAELAELPSDCSQLQIAVLQVEAHARLQEAQKANRQSLLAEAIEKAQEAGLTGAEYGAAGDSLNSLKLQENLLNRVKAATKLAPLEQALEAAESFDLGDREEVKQGRIRLIQLKAYDQLIQATNAPEPNIRHLKEALDVARAARLDDEAHCYLEEARFALHQAKVLLLKEEAKKNARDMLKEATRSLEDLDASDLTRAIKECKDCELDKVEYARAEDLLRALKLLHSYVDAETPTEIRNIIEDPTVMKLKNLTDYQKALEKLKFKESQQKALDMLQEAMEEENGDMLRAAIKEAERAKLKRIEYKEALDLLEKVEKRERELRKQAEERLVEAMRPMAPVEELEQAVKLAEIAKLDLNNDNFRKASELLLGKKETLRALVSSYSEKALMKALKNAQKYQLENTAEYKEAKLQLQRSKEVSLKTQYAENARKQLEQAIESPVTREGLERAIRSARVVSISEKEPVFQRALVLLKEIMQLEVVKLSNKIKTGLANKSLDRDRIDVMQFVKDEINGTTKAAKEAGVAEVDLEELEKVRKKVHNIVEDLKGSIRVFCRVRPLNKKEETQGDTGCIELLDPMTLEVTQVTKGIDLSQKADKFTFQYDAVFSPGTQEQVFADCKELVQSVLDGYNVTIFAYGQTGAGKTHTMAGDPGNEGIGPRTIDELYRVMDANRFRVSYDVKASIMELYCNEFVDLLQKKNSGSKPVEVKWDGKVGEVVVENCIEESCTEAKALRQVLTRGAENRKVAQTLMNHESSRSHLIFMIKVQGTQKDTGDKFKGKIVMVDLAGCERIKKSGAQAQQEKEAIEINKSLTALVDVIEALVTSQAAAAKLLRENPKAKPSTFIPYRNHKLTQLLQDTLGGPSKALMFVNCSPANSNCLESLGALRYGQRAKNVTNVKQMVAAPGGGAADQAELRARLKSQHNLGEVPIVDEVVVEDESQVRARLRSCRTSFLLGANNLDDDDD